MRLVNGFQEEQSWKLRFDDQSGLCHRANLWQTHASNVAVQRSRCYARARLRFGALIVGSSVGASMLSLPPLLLLLVNL